MKTAPDENDRLRAGTLSCDPLDGTVSWEPEGTDTPTAPLGARWVSSTDILAMPADDLSGHYWPKVIAPGVFTLVSGYPKAGKSWFLHSFVAELSRGGTWAGKQLPKVRTLYLSEESPATLRSKIVRFGIEDIEYLPLGRRGGLTWLQVMEAAVARSQEIGAGVLVADTFSAWGGLGPDDEQKEGPVRVALAPLVEAAHTHGLAVIGVHHMRKQDGDGGRAIRGSSAFGQVPDVLVELRPFGGEDSPQRSVKVQGRFDDMPPESIFTLRRPDIGPSYFDLQGTAAAAREALVEDHLLAVLSNAGAWLTEPGAIKRFGKQKAAAGRAIRILFDTHRIQRRKDGRKFLYAAKGVPLEAATLPDDPDDDPNPDPGRPADGTPSASSELPPEGLRTPLELPPTPPHKGGGREIEAPDRERPSSRTPSGGTSAQAPGRVTTGRLFENTPDARQVRRRLDEGGRP